MSKRSRKFDAQAIDTNVISLNTYYSKKRHVHLLPKTLSQERYINLLTDPEKIIVFATGPAGTGKTMLAMLAAIKALKEGTITKIVLTRPAVGVDDEKHGFLPGDLNAKLDPWVRPLIDVVSEYYDQKEIARMLDEKIIELAPLAFLRGRNLKDAFIVCDEMQNASVNQMKMILTRIAENSKMVITGDLNQRDRKFYNDDGLGDFIDRLRERDSTRIAHAEFTRRDIQRHPVVAEVLNIYGEE